MSDVEVLAPDDVPAPAPGHSTRHRLNGLDGYRALAVGVVMLYHFKVPGFGGGWVGPELFFVLSGYLITTLLIDRHRPGSGAGWLVDFWLRRIRRLFPALLFLVAMLVAIIALLRGINDPIALQVQPSSLSSESFAALGYYANWHLIAQHVGYFGISSSLLKHTWSLAIEEQFYLIFPPLFALIMLARGRYRLVGLSVALIGAGASIAIAAVSITAANVNTVYYSTQTNAYHLLIGVALAFALHGYEPSPRAQKVLGLLALPALLAIAAILVSASTPAGEPRLWMFSGGGALLDLIAAGLLACLVYGSTTTLLSKTFNLAPVMWLGAVSYGIYLWHFPFAVLLTTTNTSLPSWALPFTQIAATLLMTTFSYYFVERVVRETEIESRSLRWSIYALAVAATIVLLLVAPGLLSSLS